MSKFTLLLLAATAMVAPGCYAHTGYYAEPAYVEPAPVVVVSRPVYVEPYPYGYAHVRVTPQPRYASRPVYVEPRRTYDAPRPVYVEPRRTYDAPRYEHGPYAGAARVRARPMPRAGDSGRPLPGKTRH